MKAIYARELKSFFNNLSGYIFCAFILFFAGIYTMAINLSQASPNFEYSIANMSFVYLICVPVLTMRIIAEERKQKTDQLFYSLPISMGNVVLGKYFAMLTVLILPLLVLMFYPLILSLFGKVSFAAAYGTLLGFFALGAALTAIGMFVSSLTENQIIAGVVTIVAFLAIYYLGALATMVSVSSNIAMVVFSMVALLLGILIWYLTKNYVVAAVFFAAVEFVLIIIKNSFTSVFSSLLPSVMKKIALFDRFYEFPNGIFDITTLVFYIMIAVLFVFLTVQAMEKRRWS